jgi:hypothetical protein
MATSHQPRQKVHKMEITITVHTAFGSSTTSYTAAQIDLALQEIKDRTENNQMFTVTGK